MAPVDFRESNGQRHHDINDHQYAMSDDSLDSLGAFDQFTTQFSAQGQKILNSTSTPQQRQDLLARFQAFVAAHPKTSGFVALNLFITGVPVAFFTVFALSVAISSMIASLLFALFWAGLFTLACVGVAFSILVPTICITTIIACSVFFWLLVGIWIFRWAEAIRQHFSTTPEPPAKSDGTKADWRMEDWRNEFRDIVETDRTHHDASILIDKRNEAKP